MFRLYTDKSAALAALAFAVCLAVSMAMSPRAAAAGEGESRAAWDKIVTVLQHPRCMNCHQQNAPLQGDAGKVHVPAVTRGPADMGAGAMTCAGCHKPTGNNAMTGVPGAPHWKLAPASMVWAGLTSPQLCAMLKDKTKNGNRDGAKLIEHMEVEPLVLWGWDPGKKRTTPPIAHKDFIALMHTWVDGGMQCPK